MWSHLSDSPRIAGCLEGAPYVQLFSPGNMMSSSDGKSTDGANDIPDSPTSDPLQSSVASVRIYPSSPTSRAVHSKRSQVKNACTNCQKACKKCDPARPCLRCVKHRFTPEECVDSQVLTSFTKSAHAHQIFRGRNGKRALNEGLTRSAMPKVG
jgi:hypothetical protein